MVPAMIVPMMIWVVGAPAAGGVIVARAESRLGMGTASIVRAVEPSVTVA